MVCEPISLLTRSHRSLSLSLSLSLDIPLRTADLSVRPFVCLSFTWQRLLGDMVPGNAIKLTHGASEETKACRYSWHSAGSLGWPFPAMKYKYIFFKYNTRKQFYQPALRNCHGLNLPQCRLQFKKKRYCVVYYNLRHTFVPYKKHKTFLHLRRDAVSRSLIRSSTGVETTPLSCCLRSTLVAVCSSRLRQRRTA